MQNGTRSLNSGRACHFSNSERPASHFLKLMTSLLPGYAMLCCGHPVAGKIGEGTQ